MLKRRLGRTGFDVTALSVGMFQLTSWFGATEQSAAETLDYAMNAGLNLYDCAPLYGWGESEEHVGRALTRHGDKKLFINDKVGRYVVWEGDFPRIPAQRRDPERHYTERDTLLRCIKTSLWTLRRDHFDMLTIHEPDYKEWNFDYDTGDSVILELLEDLKKEGLLANIGLGGRDFRKMAKLVNTGRFDGMMVAGGIGLLQNQLYDELMPVAKEQDIGVIVGSVFANGNPLLSGTHRKAVEELLVNTDDEKKVITGKQLLKLYDMADDANMSIFEFTIRYVLGLEDIHTNALGFRNIEQVKADIEIIEKGPLDKAYLEEIAKVQLENKAGLDDKGLSQLQYIAEDYIKTHPGS